MLNKCIPMSIRDHLANSKCLDGREDQCNKNLKSDQPRFIWSLGHSFLVFRYVIRKTTVFNRQNLNLMQISWKVPPPPPMTLRVGHRSHHWNLLTHISMHHQTNFILFMLQWTHVHTSSGNTVYTSLNSFHPSVDTFHTSGNRFHALVNTFHASLNTFHASLNTFETSLNSFHASVDTFHTSENIFHALDNTFCTSLSTFETSVNTFHASLNTFHSSVETFHTSGNRFHALMNTFHASMNTLHAVVNTFHASLNTFKTSVNTFHASLNTCHPSLSTFHASREVTVGYIVMICSYITAITYRLLAMGLGRKAPTPEAYDKTRVTWFRWKYFGLQSTFSL